MSMPRSIALVASLSLSALFSGCADFDLGSGGGSSGPDYVDDHGSGGPVYPATYGSIPSNAERVASGAGKIEYRVPRDGTVWIGNDAGRFQILRQSVRRGDKVEIHADRDLIELNDAPLYQQNLERNDRHTIFFRQSGAGSGDWGGRGPGPYGDVPRNAENVASGSGTVTWRAEAAGTVWIGDDKLKRAITSVRVNTNDLVEINARNDQVKVNGKVVFGQNLESKNSHSVFFVAGGERAPL